MSVRLEAHEYGGSCDVVGCDDNCVIASLVCRHGIYATRIVRRFVVVAGGLVYAGIVFRRMDLFPREG